MRTLARIRGEVAALVAALDPASVSVAEAMRLSAELVELGKVVDAGAMVVAARAVEGAPGGLDAAARRLALTAGIAKAEAERMIATSKVLDELPATRSALVAGRLSRTQAALVAEAAAESPQSEAALLDTALHQDLTGLRRHVERVRSAAGDERARRAKAHAERSTRTWVRNGSWHFHAQGPVDQGARIQLAHRPFWDAALDNAPKDGHREQFGAYGFDGFVAMAEAATGGQPPPAEADTTAPAKSKPKKRRWQGVVRVDASAIRRGHTIENEVCEVVGVGPIDVAAAIDLLGEATVRILIKDGQDVLSMATATRHYPPALAIAVAERANWECSNRACSNTGYVEYDHEDDYVRSKDSSYHQLHPFCGCCHDLKTYQGYRIVHHPDGTITLEPPNDPDPP